MKYAIIGGTGVYSSKSLKNYKEWSVDTPYGKVDYTTGLVEGEEILFLSRHGQGHNQPPHQINYRGNLYALKEAGVEYILATAAVGSLHRDLHPGELVLLRDFLDFTKNRHCTFFDGEAGVAHVSMADPYCCNLRKKILNFSEKMGLSIGREGVYVCTEGPRFETSAEIKFYRQIGGDVVGMTNIPEVVLAKELGMCYATVGIVTNYCTGMESLEATASDILFQTEQLKESLTALYVEIFKSDLSKGDCTCNSSLMLL